MYTNGLGLRVIERVKAAHYTTVMKWVRAVGTKLPDAYAPEETFSVHLPQVTTALPQVKPAPKPASARI